MGREAGSLPGGATGLYSMRQAGKDTVSHS
jgi:hypothetical protein